MLKIEKYVTASPEQWEIIIEGMRNPKNSWGRMDSFCCKASSEECPEACPNDIQTCPVFDDEDYFVIGKNDHTLMDTLNEGGPVHAKYRRMIPVWVTLTAPLYWWKEFDTYKVGTVANSCSTMHKIHAYNFDRSDFSCEKLMPPSLQVLDNTITELNFWRHIFVNGGNVKMLGDEDTNFNARNKCAWEQMIQLLPTSYNQKRTVHMNYEVLCNIYKWRKNHKLDEWHTFCDWIRELPYSELIIGEEE